MIKRRHFFHISGYDPITSPELHRRFMREFAVFLRAWGLNGSVETPANASAGWSATVSGPNWSTQAHVEPMAWDDIVRADTGVGALTRLRRACYAFANVVFSGALMRYFWAFPRYGFFFLFPFVMTLGFALFAGALALNVVTFAGATGLMRALATLLVAVPIFLALFVWLGRYWRIHHGLDDWGFSAECARTLRPDIDKRIDTFVERLVEVARKRDADEIVILGHSLGASFGVEMLSRALQHHPDIFRNGPTISLVTVGATIPKFSLHPHSNWMRESLQRVVAEPAITWAEYHTKADAITFYKFDPAALEHVHSDGERRKPLIRFVQMYDMVSEAMLARISRNRMRLHYQFVMANDCRAAYDYFLFVCGPLPFETIVNTPTGYVLYLAPPALETAGTLLRSEDPT
jgi:pimeloyl-ACP methyl ester carboxylesterase